MLHEINAGELTINPFSSIGKDLFLVTSGDKNGYNTMTAGWGFFGFMWGKNVFEAVVRHSRYTYEFTEKNDLFTISFFPKERADVVKFCGSHSGRNCDKAAEANITPLFLDGTTAFEEASLVLVCRKLYAEDYDLDKLEPSLKERWYGNDSVHKQYIGEIIKAYSAEK